MSLLNKMSLPEVQYPLLFLVSSNRVRNQLILWIDLFIVYLSIEKTDVS